MTSRFFAAFFQTLPGWKWCHWDRGRSTGCLRNTGAMPGIYIQDRIHTSNNEMHRSKCQARRVCVVHFLDPIFLPNVHHFRDITSLTITYCHGIENHWTIMLLSEANIRVKVVFCTHTHKDTQRHTSHKHTQTHTHTIMIKNKDKCTKKGVASARNFLPSLDVGIQAGGPAGTVEAGVGGNVEDGIVHFRLALCVKRKRSNVYTNGRVKKEII